MNKTCGDCQFCEIQTELENDIYICTMIIDDKENELIVELEDKACSLFKHI